LIEKPVVNVYVAITAIDSLSCGQTDTRTETQPQTRCLRIRVADSLQLASYAWWSTSITKYTI